MHIKTALAAAIVLAACVQAKAAPGSIDPIGGEKCSKAELAGTVHVEQTSKPLRDVTVTAYTASKKEKTVTTDERGTYSFGDLKPGVYKVVFEREGYRKVVKDKVAIRTDEEQKMHVNMEEEEKYFNWLPGFHHLISD